MYYIGLCIFWNRSHKKPQRSIVVQKINNNNRRRLRTRTVRGKINKKIFFKKRSGVECRVSAKKEEEEEG